MGLNIYQVWHLFSPEYVSQVQKSELAKKRAVAKEGKVWWFDAWKKELYSNFEKCQQDLQQKADECKSKLTADRVAALKPNEKENLCKEALDLIHMLNVAEQLQKFVKARDRFTTYTCNLSLDYLKKENNFVERHTLSYSADQALSRYKEKKEEARECQLPDDFYPDLPPEDGPQLEDCLSGPDTLQKVLEATQASLREIDLKSDGTPQDKVTKALRLLQLIVKEHQFYMTAALCARLAKKPDQPAEATAQ